ncbi:bifunctional diaminohydroxyphosphoribosylaminopyrimidine deaminase/5-amino-6-(5-phosphoribosylamino)uracil reductase RibD [Mongoliimonas terrestris]|uniref:bifunctional diaminohydroxyphosphoribosylaminopyrimidine deaminase/5-amino-6-(5-phosphoribosylamino)uracil reductase RibD n=1 Tax=Mongoliimonas terrestris TaxID=1709001 RepID=UPI0009495D09|nr:bifunctional diaminohydroxyphosphoribosylaminopyrimidine deaminase/5-amino-6-(5-phosphoribosylamino)uracil reductase RibD [Mongoliimonas terrestris]
MNRPVRAPGAVKRPTVDPELDRRFMAAALALGRRNNGVAWPNPSVGALLVQFGPNGPEVVGRGTTAPGGRPHAEAVALAMAGERARGATAYVTLEPCSHHGRTPPCSEALIRAGVSRVVTGIEDPDPRVAGRGHELLRRSGVIVTCGCCERDARYDLSGHVTRIRLGRPRVMLKLALSADHCIGREGDGQISISGPLSRAYAHTLRLENDAILVGVGTVLADDPELTCRLPGLFDRSPVRIILDSMARTPPTAKIVATARTVPTWIFTAPDAPSDAVETLADAGVSIAVAERDRSGGVDFADVLFQMGQKGLTRLMVEGGSTVARRLIEEDLVDEVQLVFGSVTIGAGGVPALAGLPVEDLIASPRFQTRLRRRLGDDRLIQLVRKEIG